MKKLKYKKFIKLLSYSFFLKIILIIKFSLFINLYFKKSIKVCLCTIGKEENRYIKEFVKYYKNYKIDKIFLYDNNDINGEKFNEIIKYYIDIRFVKIINWRGKKRTMIKAWNDCYLKFNKKYDWLIFFDIDEYIHLDNYKSIKTFLNEKKFKNCKKIYLNWMIHTDNDLIYYDNRSLHERFPQLENRFNVRKKNIYGSVKSIIRGKIQKLKINKMHILSKNIKGCNGFGQDAILNNEYHMKNPDYKLYYIDHFYSKSVEEFIEKLNKGDVFFENKTFFKMHRIKRYFKLNKITWKKINYIEKNTGLNLSKYKKKLINKTIQ